MTGPFDQYSLASISRWRRGAFHIRSSVTYSCNNHYTQPIVVRSKALFFRYFSARPQHKPITAAVQPTPHIRAPAAVIDLIAVADIETQLGAVPPNRVLNEPGKHIGKPWIEPAGIDGHSNVNEERPRSHQAGSRPGRTDGQRQADLGFRFERGSCEPGCRRHLSSPPTRFSRARFLGPHQQ